VNYLRVSSGMVLMLISEIRSQGSGMGGYLGVRTRVSLWNKGGVGWGESYLGSQDDYSHGRSIPDLLRGVDRRNGVDSLRGRRRNTVTRPE
jgi:hypothetical protein